MWTDFNNSSLCDDSKVGEGWRLGILLNSNDGEMEGCLQLQREGGEREEREREGGRERERGRREGGRGREREGGRERGGGEGKGGEGREGGREGEGGRGREGRRERSTQNGHSVALLYADLGVSDMSLLETESHGPNKSFILGWFPCKSLPYVRNLGYHTFP